MLDQLRIDLEVSTSSYCTVIWYEENFSSCFSVL
jgi:hypothetical protein